MGEAHRRHRSKSPLRKKSILLSELVASVQLQAIYISLLGLYLTCPCLGRSKELSLTCIHDGLSMAQLASRCYADQY